jgi:adenine-specific DNA-methyltransferase
MQRNAEDGGRRRFILVQLPENVPEGTPARALGLTTIPEITRERLRRTGASYSSVLGAAAGFRAMRVVSSKR